MRLSTYEILCAANARLIRRQPVPDCDKQAIVKTLLSVVNPHADIRRFHAGVRASADDTTMFPLFYVPPYHDGRKCRLLCGSLPTTHLLSANHYELEILRLLALWAPKELRVTDMVKRTLDRLRAACFGRYCAKGECVGASVAALRFLTAVKPASDPWIDAILQPLGEIFVGQRGQASTHRGLPIFYFCLALSETASDMAAQIIRRRSDFLLGLLRKGWLTGPAELDTYNPLRKVIVRNALAALPDYAHLRHAGVYVSEKDGRCYCAV